MKIVRNQNLEPAARMLASDMLFVLPALFLIFCGFFGGMFGGLYVGHAVDAALGTLSPVHPEIGGLFTCYIFPLGMVGGVGAAFWVISRMEKLFGV